MIGQAVGIMKERFELDADRAFSLLVRLSSMENSKLFDIASELVDERRRPVNQFLGAPRTGSTDGHTSPHE